jgi:type VI secretion system protein ImpG
MLPEKFMGFRLSGLQAVLPRIKARQADIIFTFNRPDPRLPAAVRPSMFQLFAAPAVNLFEMQTSRIPVSGNEFEYQVVPDRGRYLDYEPHRIVRVIAHFVGSGEKQELHPLYAPPPDNVPQSDVIHYSLRRLTRKRTVEERRYGKSSNYTGTDMFITLAPNPTALRDRIIAELSVRAICSNRHLTEHLPVGQGGADFVLETESKLEVSCLAGPTTPRESVITAARDQHGQSGTRSTAWRLISMLSLNHLGLSGRGTENSAAALREILTLFAESNDAASEARIRGILKVESQPAVRRVRQPDGSATVRGLEVTLTMDEKAYEGSGLFLFGAVLDRFLAEYAPINSFVQTVVRSNERGEVMRWPPRVGARVSL